VERHDLFQ